MYCVIPYLLCWSVEFTIAHCWVQGITKIILIILRPNFHKNTQNLGWNKYSPEPIKPYTWVCNIWTKWQVIGFHKWFKEVLPRLPNKSCVVIENASYRAVFTEDLHAPTSSSRKDEIQDWQKKVQNHVWKDTIPQIKILLQSYDSFYKFTK